MQACAGAPGACGRGKARLEVVVAAEADVVVLLQVLDVQNGAALVAARPQALGAVHGLGGLVSGSCDGVCGRERRLVDGDGARHDAAQAIAAAGSLAKHRPADAGRGAGALAAHLQGQGERRRKRKQTSERMGDCCPGRPSTAPLGPDSAAEWVISCIHHLAAFWRAPARAGGTLGHAARHARIRAPKNLHASRLWPLTTATRRCPCA